MRMRNCPVDDLAIDCGTEMCLWSLGAELSFIPTKARNMLERYWQQIYISHNQPRQAASERTALKPFGYQSSQTRPDMPKRHSMCIIKSISESRIIHYLFQSFNPNAFLSIPNFFFLPVFWLYIAFGSLSPGSLPSSPACIWTRRFVHGPL